MIVDLMLSILTTQTHTHTHKTKGHGKLLEVMDISYYLDCHNGLTGACICPNSSSCID